ncbi:MAG TPA: hypothetical protein VIH57_08375 [Bacteroidales bacterium]
MKILAIEKELKPVDWSKFQQILKDEANRVYELYQYDYIREIYFNENNQAVLILECENKEHAAELLNTLPLAESKLIAFDLTELRPYSGYSRLMNI